MGRNNHISSTSSRDSGSIAKLLLRQFKAYLRDATTIGVNPDAFREKAFGQQLIAVTRGMRPLIPLALILVGIALVTKTRDKTAALTFMKKTLKRHGNPETITTDGLRSYRAAMNQLRNAEKQEIGRWANNWVENSHLPFRRRERAMLRFRQMKALQKFASIHANVHNHFSLERHLTDRQTYENDTQPHWLSGRC